MIRFNPSRWHADAAACAFLLLPLGLGAVVLLSGSVWSPAANLHTTYPWQGSVADPGAANPALSDVTQWFHPALLWGGAEIRAGRFPLWVPNAYCGAPFFANPQTALLFPLTWLAWILPPALALTLITGLKMVIAGLAMYWFLRRVLGAGVIAGLIGALGFQYSTTLVGWIGWAFGNTIVLLPLLFGFVECARERRSRRWVAGLAVIVALEIVAGYPQAAFHALLAAGAWALGRARGAEPWFLARCAAGVGLGIGLAAVQIVPFLEYARESTVLAYREQWMPSFAAPASSMITHLLPYAFGSGHGTWSRWQFNVVSTYVGLVPVLIAPLGLMRGRPRPVAVGMGWLFLVAAGIHYGAPLLGSLASLPGLALGTNLRLMPLMAFGISALVALGVDALRRGEVDPGGLIIRAWYVVCAAGAFAWVVAHAADPGALQLRWSLPVQCGIALAGLTAAAVVTLRWLFERRAVWGVALAALQALSVVPPAVSYLPRTAAAGMYPETPALAWLRARAGMDRVVMPGHLGVLYGLHEAHGYDGMTPRRVAELVGTVGSGAALLEGRLQNPLAFVGSEALSPASVYTSLVLDLLGVRYVMQPPGSGPLWPHLALGHDGLDARVFVNDRALPRVFVASRARCADDEAARRSIRDRAIDLREEVILADCTVPPALTGSSGSTAEVREYGPDRVEIATDAAAEGYLVLTDTWFPGWRAWVDGQEVDVLRADHAFRAVRIPPGRHAVRFRYEPRSVRTGLRLSGLSAAALLLLALPWTRRGRG